MFDEKFWTEISSSLPSFEQKLIMAAGLLFVIALLLTATIVRRRFKRMHPVNDDHQSEYKRWQLLVEKSFKVVGKLSYILLLLLLILTAMFIALSLLLARPYGKLVNAQEDGRIMSTGEKIEVLFDIPVPVDRVVPSISPEVKGEWKFEDELFPGYARKAVFYPEESFYPGDKIVVYLTGLKRIASGGDQHEQSIETFAPKPPEVEETSPSDMSENVPVDTSYLVEFESVVGDFVIFDFDIVPPVQFNTRVEGVDELIIDFESELAQDAEYNIKLYRSLRSYQVSTDETVKQGDRELIWEGAFFTVRAPAIEEVSHSGDLTRPDLPLLISFTEEMDQSTIEDSIVIEPATEGELSWEDGNTLVFTPDGGFEKDTSYQIRLPAGIKTKYGGKTDEEILLKFSTLGKVIVESFSPANGSTGVDPTVMNIAIKFNQEVDRGSAESKVHISPDPGGGRSWDGNTLRISTAGKLAYDTRYTVTVSPGVVSKYGIDSVDKFTYVFTTRVRTFILSIPRYYQQETFTCNIAAARMALAYRGVHVTESQIKSAIGTGGNPNSNWVEGYGVHADPLATYIRRHRSATVHRGWSASALAKEIESGNPVILYWYNRRSQPKGAFILDSGATGYKGMHSEVVVGFTGSSDNPRSFIVNDPWRGRLTYSRSLFDSTWSYMNRTAIVVY